MSRPPKPGTPRSLSRSKRGRPKLEGDILLIVCEGAKTEPVYFEDLKRLWKLQAAQVFVSGSGGASDPLSVVKQAVRLREKRKDNAERGGPPRYDQVWCVVDRDQHKKLPKAVDLAKAENIRLVLSTPCFEFWYLLHFAYTAKPFGNCRELIRDLRNHLPAKRYSKSGPPLDLLLHHQGEALENASKLRKHRKKVGGDNPSTDVDLLVTELRSLKPRLAR